MSEWIPVKVKGLGYLAVRTEPGTIAKALDGYFNSPVSVITVCDALNDQEAPAVSEEGFNGLMPTDGADA